MSRSRGPRRTVLRTSRASAPAEGDPVLDAIRQICDEASRGEVTTVGEVDALFRILSDDVKGFFWSRLGDRAAAEDATNNAFVRILKARNKKTEQPFTCAGRTPKEVRSYVWKAAKAQWKDILRSQRATIPLDQADEPMSDEDLSAAVVEDQFKTNHTQKISEATERVERRIQEKFEDPRLIRVFFRWKILGWTQADAATSESMRDSGEGGVSVRLQQLEDSIEAWMWSAMREELEAEGYSAEDFS